MTTSLKILLVAAAGLFLASLTDAGSAIAWGFLKPLSAILFIVFFIGQLLHKEVVKYDEECRSRMMSAKPAENPTLPSKLLVGARRPLGNNPTFAQASH